MRSWSKGLNIYKLEPISVLSYKGSMKWTIVEHPEFIAERNELDDEVSDKLDEIIIALEKAGPNLGRPMVDTLKGSRHKNMKEIRMRSKVRGDLPSRSILTGRPSCCAGETRKADRLRNSTKP
jgi:Phage derived protein Gp49-like (DUF891)